MRTHISAQKAEVIIHYQKKMVMMQKYKTEQ